MIKNTSHPKATICEVLAEFNKSANFGEAEAIADTRIELEAQVRAFNALWDALSCE